jgi:hypothetical protein
MSTINNCDPILQRVRMRPEPLIFVQDTATRAAVTAKFRIRIPDARLQVKVSLLFVSIKPSAPFPDDLSGMAPTIWLYAADQDDSGVGGGDVPVTNILGTEAVPQAFPLTTGLRGISTETKGTLADYLEGVLTAKSDSVLKGIWYLSVTYQPLNVTLPMPIWERITNLFNISNTHVEVP